MILMVLVCSIPSVYARSYGVTYIAKGNNGYFSGEDYTLNIRVRDGNVVEYKDYLYNPSGSINFNDDDVQIRGSSIWRWGYRLNLYGWEEVLLEGIVQVNSEAGWWVRISMIDKSGDRKNMNNVDGDTLTIELWAPNTWSIDEETLTLYLDNPDNPDYVRTILTYMYSAHLPQELPQI